MSDIVYNENRLVKIEELIKALTNLFGVSSDESSVTEYIQRNYSGLFDEIKTDESGNAIGCVLSNQSNVKTLLIEAHMDRIGLMVSEICDDGRIKFVTIGGVDTRILPYSRVEFDCGNKIQGVIINESEEKDKIPSAENMCIFTGYTAEELDSEISIGTKAIIRTKTQKLCNHQLTSGALDNRAGIASVLTALENVNRDKLKYNIKIMFSTEEELGLHGGYTGTKNLSADAAVIIDVTHGITFDTKNDAGVFKLGCGAVICRGPSLDHRLTKNLMNLAKKRLIPFETEVAASNSGTTAWAIQTAGMGIPATLVSIPLKYMHTNVETINTLDVLAVSDLLCAAMEEGIGID